MSGTTRKVSIGMLVIKGKLGKMWALSGRKQGDLVTQDMGKAEVLNDFFCLGLFAGKCSNHHYRRAGEGLFTRARSIRKGDGFKLRVGLD